jgi:hypothetical protein
MLTSTRLFGDGKHGHAERIQTFRGPACRTTFTARRDTPLYRLKTPSCQVALVLTVLGSWAGSFRRRAGLRLPTSDHHEPFCPVPASTLRPYTNAPISQPLAPAPPVGRTAHQAAQLQTGAVAVASHRSPHEDSSRALSGSPHTTCGAYAYPLPTATTGS